MQRSPEQVPTLPDGPGVDVSDTGELLVGYLAVVSRGAAAEDLRVDRRTTPHTGRPLGWSPLGLVQHLGWVERRWIRWGFAAEGVLAHLPDGDEAEWSIPGHLDVAES
ncbi:MULTISPECIES: DUF664 domain-containing protein [unclassified Streptomyces]|uniref:DUF664 domain-containing protein n=1 Tax=Streptomyces TaxID=1883 RepID=UPI001928DBE5|nr:MULTISPECIES: DUF664 domain-containing protein [unclassified Streptomyces]